MRGLTSTSRALYEHLARRMRYPLTAPGRGRSVLDVLGLLERTDERPRASLERYQRAKLEGLLAFVATRSSWYGRVLAEQRMDPIEAATDEGFRRVPILTKEHVRAHRDALMTTATTAPGISSSSTGGSTGAPLVVYKDPATVAWSEAALWRGKGWAGIGFSDRVAAIKASGGISTLGLVRQRLMSTLPLKAFGGDEAMIRSNLEAIRSFRPKGVMSYVTTLLTHAEVARRSPELATTIPVILTTGEMLYDHQRRLLEEVFGGVVHDYYGSNEIGGLAFECEEGRKHVTDEHVLLEVVDEEGQPVWDTPGRIVVTDLDNRAMPLVRYDNGDRGVLSSRPCPCGRPTTVLERLEGRTQDMLSAPDGRTLPAIFFASKYRGLRGISSYQLVQTGPTEVVLRFVGRGAGVEEELAAMEADIATHLGSSMQVRREPLDALEVTARGKLRLVMGRSPARSTGTTADEEVPAP